MRELWYNIAHTSGAKIYSMVIGIVTLSLTARLLGPEGCGQVAVITTWVNMFSTFVFLSLGQVALHRMAEDKYHEGFGNIFASLLLMAVVLAFVGWLVALGFYWYDPADGIFKDIPRLPLVVGFFALPFMIWEQYGSSLLMGLDRIRVYNRYQVIGRTVSVVAVFTLLGGLGFGVAGVFEARLLGQVIIALGGIGFLFSFVKANNLVFWPAKSEIKALLVGGAKLHFNAIGTFLFTSANVLILNNYHGAEQTGYFQLAIQLLGVLMIIPQAVSMVVFGKVTSLGPNEAWGLNKKVLLQTTFGMVILGIIAALLAPWGITFLAGNSFSAAVAPFQWMLLGLIGMTFSTIMAPQWIGRGYFSLAAALTLFVGAVNLLGNFWLIPIYGMQGAVYVFIATYVFSIFGNGAMAWHCERLQLMST